MPQPEPDAPKAVKSAKIKRAEGPPVEPTLTAYFGKDVVQPAPFLKAVRAAKIHQFVDDDIKAASSLALETDPIGSRLLALAAMPALPKAVERWIWPEIQAFLRT